MDKQADRQIILIKSLIKKFYKKIISHENAQKMQTMKNLFETRK
jgi:hypothetical protein